MRALALAAAALLTCARAATQQDLEALVDRLGAEDASVRSQAYQELQRRRDPAMVPLLGKRIASFPAGGQQLAVYLLQGQPIDASRAVFRQLTAEKAPFLRAAGAAHLARAGERAHLTDLRKALLAMPEAERLQAVNLVHGLADAGVADALRSYLHSGASAAVVVSALQQLRQLEKGSSAPTCAAAATLRAATDAGVRAAALAFLAAAGDAPAARDLTEMLAAEPTRFWNVRFLLDTDRKLPPDLVAAIARLLTEARSKYDVTQTAALLQKQAPAEVGPALRPLLKHGNADIRGAALEALAALPGGLEQKELQAMLHGEHVELQLAAAAVLRRMDDPSGLPIVLALLPKAGAHKAEAVRVLGAFCSREVPPVLLDLLDDTDQQVRQHAWTALQDLLRDLFPYRRFDFARSGYEPQQGNRGPAIATLRAWWANLK